MPQPEEDIVPEIAPEVSEAPLYDVRVEPPDKEHSLLTDDVESDVIPDVKMEVMTEQEAMNDLDDVINELAEQYELSDIDDGSTEPQSMNIPQTY